MHGAERAIRGLLHTRNKQNMFRRRALNESWGDWTAVRHPNLPSLFKGRHCLTPRVHHRRFSIHWHVPALPAVPSLTHGQMSSQVQLTSAVEDEKADLAVEEPQLRRRASTASGLLKEREEVLLGADKLRALHLEEDTLALLQRVPMFSTFSTVLNGLGFSVYGVRNSGRGLQAYAIVLLVLYLHSACGGSLL